MDRKNGHLVFQVLLCLFRRLFQPASLCIGTNVFLLRVLVYYGLSRKGKHFLNLFCSLRVCSGAQTSVLRSDSELECLLEKKSMRG